MATFKQGINGGFTGKVGSVIGYQLNGQWVMRSLAKPSSKNKKGTALQKACRSIFASMQHFLQPLIPFIRVGYNLESRLRMMTAHNAAKSYNMLHALDVNGDIDCAKVCLTFGSLMGVANPVVLKDDVGLHFSWENNAGNSWLRETDQVMVMAYNVKDQQVYFKLSGTRRSDGMESIEIPAFEKDNELHTWISFISDDRQHIAMSTYTGMVVI
jgi:hypothetical protein